MDSLYIFIILFATLTIKFFYINGWVYNRLRINHSKTYINKNYNSIKQKLLFSGLIKEIGYFLYILNIILIFMFVISVLLLVVSFIGIWDLSHIVDLLMYNLIFILLISFIYNSVNLVIFNKNAKGQQSDPISRILYAVVILFLFAFCVLK